MRRPRFWCQAGIGGGDVVQEGVDKRKACGDHLGAEPGKLRIPGIQGGQCGGAIAIGIAAAQAAGGRFQQGIALLEHLVVVGLYAR